MWNLHMRFLLTYAAIAMLGMTSMIGKKCQLVRCFGVSGSGQPYWVWLHISCQEDGYRKWRHLVHQLCHRSLSGNR